MIAHFAGSGRLGLSESRWISESGLEFATRELRPVVDESTGRLYAMTPFGTVVLLKEYEHYRRSSARNAAITFWGAPNTWAAIDEKVVVCECSWCDVPIRDWSSAWRITRRTNGIIKARIVCISDGGVEIVGDEHDIFASPHLIHHSGQYSAPGDATRRARLPLRRTIDIDTFSAMVERFGEPYDMATGAVGLPYRLESHRS